MFKKELEKVKNYKPGKPIEEVKNELGLKEVYKLASNESPFLSKKVRKAITEELANINRYPQGDCFYLRNKLAQKLGVQTSQIIFGNGSDEIISFVIQAMINKDDEVIIANPTFLIYEIKADIAGAKVIKVPLKNFRHDLEAMAKSVTNKTKLIIIANPNNPTGTYVTNQEVEKFLKEIPKNIFVLFDEAYFEFAPKNDFPRSKEFLDKRGNFMFTRTFSKIYALAGLRIGYGVTTQAIADILNKVRDPFNINRLAQVAASAALDDNEFVKKFILSVDKEKEFLYSNLNKLDIEFVKTAANFIYIDVKRDSKALEAYLLKKGIIIRELSGWGCKNSIRVTIGKHKENRKFIDCLKIYLESL